MEVTMKFLLILISFVSLNAFAHSDLLERLKETQLSLMEGVEQIESQHGPAISAKFEIKKNILKLSVYTVQNGMQVGAEKNGLLELIGDATQPTWNPNRVEFQDKPHIARASVQLSLLQLGHYSFKNIVAMTQQQHPGMVYSVKPKLINDKALVEILILTPQRRSKKLYFDLFSGNIIDSY